MKKKLFIFTLVLALCLVVTGCGKEKDKEEKDDNVDTSELDGGWENIYANQQIGLSEEDIQMFNSATEEYVGMNFEPVAILGTQVVAGTNYMFLVKGTPVVQNPKTSYKTVIIYKDLEGKASITSVNDFDYTKYTNKAIERSTGQTAGGWTVSAPGKLYNLDDETVQAAWDKATETLTGMIFNPIAVVGKQLVAGYNYAVLCYGKGSYPGAIESVYLVTLYVSFDETSELVSTAYVDLADYNK